MRRLIGSVLLLGLALLLVLLAGIAWIAWHFNPQAQARQLAEQVEARSGYLLSTAAPPRLTFTPRLGLTWGPLLLESPADDGPTGAATRRVATAQGMHLSLDALALLRGETRVRQVRIEGLSLWPAPDRRYALPAVDLSLSDSAASETLLPGTTTPPGRGMDPASTDPHLAPALTHALTLEATVLDAAGQALPLRLQGRIGVEAGASPLAGAAPVQRRAFHLLLQGSFDQTTFTLDATRTDASPVLRFDLALGTLDLDRYQARPLAQPALATASWQAGAAPDTTGLVGSWGSDLAGPGADASSDRMAAARPAVRTTGTGALLRWVHDLGLDSLDLQGAVRVASLQFMNVKLTHLRLQA
ncbi:hypothetical protein P3G55_24905, partial [Leptospira sp. 96542]|nr:hypothetical protein [Leptospira sp. 96542]